MPSSAILDVAIGIAFVYLFLSLICSVVNEGIASIFSLRAKNLVHGINSLFSQSTLATGRAFVDAIYAHGLIRGLYLDPRTVNEANPLGTPDKVKPANDKDAPSSDDARVRTPFGDITRTVNELITENLHFPSVLGLAKKWRVNLPAYIPSRTFSTALIDVISPPDPARARVLDDVRQAIAALPPSATKQALLSLVAGTQKDITEFQDKVEAWFNDSMDRASGWYKKRTQNILLGIGLVVTLALNVNTIKLAQTLWSNPVARQATVQLAQQYVDENKEGLKDNTGDLKQQAEKLSDLAKQMPFAFGWQQTPQGDWKFWVTSIAGWIITTLALSLGAPFWFDMLNKFMVVRSTVKPREKSSSEKSKDG